MQYFKNNSIGRSDLVNFALLGAEKYKANKDIEDTKRSKAKKSGSILHRLVFEGDTFDDYYAVGNFNVPEGKVTDFVKLKSELIVGQKIPIEEAEKIAYEQCNFSWPLKTVITKSQESIYKEYYEHLLATAGREIVSAKEYAIAKKELESLQKDVEICELLFKNNDTITLDSVEVPIYVNEFEYYYILKGNGWELPAKIKIDRYIHDTKTDTITLIDLKTTDDIKNFKYSYKKYKYYLQMAWYKLGLLDYLFNTYYGSYKINTKLIVVDSNYPHPTQIFDVHEKDIEAGTSELMGYAEELAWHITNDIWVDKDKHLKITKTLNIF